MDPSDPASDWIRDRLSDGKCLKIAILSFSTGKIVAVSLCIVMMIPRSVPPLLHNINGNAAPCGEEEEEGDGRGQIGHRQQQQQEWENDFQHGSFSSFSFSSSSRFAIRARAAATVLFLQSRFRTDLDFRHSTQFNSFLPPKSKSNIEQVPSLPRWSLCQ